MEYHGKLYGKIGDKYFDTSHSTDDWDLMEKKIPKLESNNESLLEALQDLVKYFGYLDEDSEYVIKAKAAINKALK